MLDHNKLRRALLQSEVCDAETTLTRVKNISTGTTVYYDPCSMNTCWWSSYRQQQTTVMAVDGQ